MISERYERYEQRMLILRRILLWIKKYYKVITIPLVCVTAATLTFLAFVGTFTGALSCEGCVYGERPSAYAEAFLSDVRYEYCTEDGVWRNGLPTEAGEYQVRAVSTTGFGKPRYSDSAPLSIAQRELRFSYGEVCCLYGEENLYFSSEITPLGLADGDTIADTGYASAVRSSETLAVWVESFRIVNRDGTDVTASYRYEREEGLWTLEKRTLCVTTGSAKRVYDGTILQADTYGITVGSLLDGQTIHAVYEEGQTDVGEKENVAHFTVLDAEGNDVSEFYQIVPTFGTLAVTPLPITVTSDSAASVCDGEMFTCESFTITSGKLVNGHAVHAEFTGSLLYAGQVDNTFTCVILDEAGRDVSQNYDIVYEYGTLSLSPIELKFETGSASKVYDGTPLTNSEWKHLSGSLAKGHSFAEITTTGRLTDVGKIDNTLSVRIVDSLGNDVTEKMYKIEVEHGTLEIAPIVLKFRTGSAKKVYDGKPLTNGKWEHISGKLAKGHSFVNTHTTGSRTDVGTSNNTLSVQIVNEEGVDVTKKMYRIEVEYGTLTVTPKAVEIESGSAQKAYDGTPLTKHSYSWNSKSFCDGHYPSSSTFTGSQTEIGKSPNTFTVKILDENTGRDVTANYSIKYVYGTLSVVQGGSHKDENQGQDQDGGFMIGYPPPSDGEGGPIAEFWVSGLSQSTRLYLRERSGGDYLKNGWTAGTAFSKNILHNPQYLSGTKLLQSGVSTIGFSIDMKVSNLTLTPYFLNYANGERIGFRGDDVKMTLNAKRYSTQIYAPLNTAELLEQVEKAKKTNVTWVSSYEMSYREFVYKTYLNLPTDTKQKVLQIAEKNGIRADSATLITDIQSFVQHAGRYNENGKNYPANADVAVYFLETAKEGICQHFATTATVMYRCFGIPARYTVGFSPTANPVFGTQYVTSESAHAWVEIYLDGIGWIPVEVTGSDDHGGGGGGGGGVSQSPNLVISTYSAEKFYDSYPMEPWNGEKYWISEGALQKGHRLTVSVIETGAQAAGIGIYSNEIENIKIVDAKGNDVTDEYKIMVEIGACEIKKRPITVMSASATKVYDGTALTDKRYWLIKGTLAPNHTLEVNVTATLTEKGTKQNSFTVTIRDREGKRVNQFYDISSVLGTLTVTAP